MLVICGPQCGLLELPEVRDIYAAASLTIITGWPHTAIRHHKAYSSPIKCCCESSTWIGDPVSAEMSVSDCV